MAARSVEYKEDEVIIREGEADKRMFIVTKGVVALYANYGQENERVLGLCTSNKLFGEIGLLTGTPNPYTAVAYSDVELAYFTENNLLSFIKGYPQLAIKILYNVAKMSQLLGENLKMVCKELEETTSQENFGDFTVRNSSESISYNMAKFMVQRTGKGDSDTFFF